MRLTPLAPLLRVPPFPGSQPASLVGASSATSRISGTEVEEAIEAMARARVGGEYWGSQPPLPQPPYTLIRVRDAERRSSLLSSLRSSDTLLCWTDAIPREPSNDAATFVSGRCDPWHLVSGASRVVADPDEELVLIAVLAGRPVHFPDDLAPGSGGGATELLAALKDRLAGGAYANPFTGEAMGLLEAIELCAFWRRLIDSNRPIAAAIGFAAWKQTTAAPLLWAGSTAVPFKTSPHGLAAGDEVAAWKSRVAPATLAQLERQGAKLVEVEDGFIRSVGLGADCVPPLSLVVDRLGAYFDPQHPSELELIIEGSFPSALIDRARRLRELIIEQGVSKYGVGQQVIERRAERRRHILVPGQVEDDRSVLCGGGAVRTNKDLLSRVRRDSPDANIIYKPHPDVEAGHRAGALSNEEAMLYADEIARDGPISAWIEMVDEVHVNTSLAGFEALMRGKPVTTHGVPFYAGWGLTRDLGAVPGRRTARRTLDELAAATLLLYPRYLDPVTRIPCPPEILVRRLADGAGAQRGGPLVPLRRLQGQVKRRLASLRDWGRW